MEENKTKEKFCEYCGMSSEETTGWKVCVEGFEHKFNSGVQDTVQDGVQVPSPTNSSGKVLNDPKKDRREAMLAVFVEFVEQEAHRIDEERRGAYRRDGGRIMRSSIFLDQFLSTTKQETQRELLEEILHKFNCYNYHPIGVLCEHCPAREEVSKVIISIAASHGVILGEK